MTGSAIPFEIPRRELPRPVPVTFYTDVEVDGRIAALMAQTELSQSETVHRLMRVALGLDRGAQVGVPAEESPERSGDPADADGNVANRRRSDDRRIDRAS